VSGYVKSAIDLYDKLSELVGDQAEWSQATFGTDQERGPVGALKHLQKEAREAHEAYERLSIARTANVGREEAVSDAKAELATELADCLLLLLDASRRSGIKFATLVDHAKAKMIVNRQRTWPKPTSDEPVEHVR
jgi:hypothetical protein